MRACTPLPFLLLASAAQAEDETYDFVIAGAGTAGLVIANRLSADPNITVVVVDPGDNARDYPGVLTVEDIGDTFNASIDWAYKSIPQPNIGNRSIQYHAGKAIGGTSTINGMAYIRGNKAQFDAWESLGNEGWNWDTIYKYSKTAENFTVPSSAQLSAGVQYDAEAHGESGPLKTGYIYNLDNSTFHYTLQQGFEAQGLPRNQDLDDGETRGFASYPQTVDRDANVREDAARAYYYPVEGRPNLKIINGTVKRVTWTRGSGEEDLSADGVEFVNPTGDLLTVKAVKEVILSAGTWRTPLILEGSGVGNPSILTQQTRIDLPTVGESLQDQWVATLVYNTTTNMTGHVPYVIFPTAQDVFGDQTAAIGASVKANISSWAQAASDARNGSVSAAAIEERFQIQHDLIFNQNVTIAEIYTVAGNGTLGSSYWILMPFSWGYVHSDASVDIAKPVIDANVLSVDFDLQMSIGVGRLVQKAWTTPPLNSLVLENVVPGESVLPTNATDAQWATFTKGAFVSSYHNIGTCAMMSRELGGVVDPTLKVYGTQNVRVVDASIIPIQLDGHPTAMLYGVAERAAVLIKESWM